MTEVGSPQPDTGSDEVRRAPLGKASAQSQVRGSALLLVGRVIAMGMGLVIQLLLVRLLTKDDYGAFAWGLSVVTLVQAFVPLGLDRVDTRFLAVADEEGDDRRVVGVLVGETAVILATGTTAFLVVLFLHERLAGGLAPSPLAADLLVLLVLLAPLGAIDAMVLNTFATFARPRAVFFRRYVLEPGLRLSAIVLVFALGRSVVGLAFAYVLASTFGVVLYVVMVVRLLSGMGVLAALHGRIVVPMRELIVQGFPLLTSTLVYATTNALPALVLGAVSTAAAVADLRAVQPVASLSLAASTAFAVLYLPMAARMWTRGQHLPLRLSYWRTGLWVALASYPALLIGTSFADTTTVTLLGQRYSSSAPLMVISAVGFWFQGATGFSAQVLVVADRRRFLLGANLASLALGGITALLLIPDHGAAGAAITMSVTLVGASVFRQLGLHGLSPGVVDRMVAGPYVVMVLVALGLAGAEHFLQLHFVAAIVVSLVVSSAVVLYTVPLLDVRHTFPELLRIPVAGSLLEWAATRRAPDPTNPYLNSTGDHGDPPDADADDDGGRDGAGAGSSAVSGWSRDPRSYDLDLLVPDGRPVLRRDDVALTDLRDVIGEVPAGGWVVIGLARAPKPWRALSRAAVGAGLQEVALYWEAPRRSQRRMLVPLESRRALQVALGRHEGSRGARAKSALGRLLVAPGLGWVLTGDVVLVGRKGPL